MKTEHSVFKTNYVIVDRREIFRVLDLMKMDMANFTLQQIRPYIQKQSVEYEGNKFKQFLATQEGSFILTRLHC